MTFRTEGGRNWLRAVSNRSGKSLLPMPGCFSGMFLDVAALLLLKPPMTYKVDFPNVILNVRAKCSSHDGLEFTS
jgi:hypothetical protein